MKVITVCFDYESMTTYKRLLDVFVYSVQKHMPFASLEIIKAKAPTECKRQLGLVSNTAKLGMWIDALKRSEDKQVILMDCDMLVLGNMGMAFQYEFDIAYTIRHIVEHGRLRVPLNGGVVFVNVNDRSLEFLEKWKEVNNTMFLDNNFHLPWKLKYAGMNQAAFGYMLENPQCDCDLLALPCSEWNLCNNEWHLFDPDVTRCIHYKSQLRRAVLGQGGYYNYQMHELVRLWKSYEAEMHRANKLKRIYDAH